MFGRYNDPIALLCIYGGLNILGSVFSFSVVFKPNFVHSFMLSLIISSFRESALEYVVGSYTYVKLYAYRCKVIACFVNGNYDDVDLPSMILRQGLLRLAWSFLALTQPRSQGFLPF